MTAHRRGWKKRPECGGKITCIWDGKEHPTAYFSGVEGQDSPELVSPTPATSLTAPLEEVEGQEVAPPLTPPRSLLEAVPSLVSENTDPEVEARLLNLQRNREREVSGDGNGHGVTDLSEFVLEPGVSPLVVSENRIVIVVPVQVQNWYDWARKEGWFQGDGSIGAFVTDFLMDHINHCLGMGLFYIRREEIGVA